MIFNVPLSFSFPITIVLPTSPILLKMLVGNPSVVPWAAVPMVVPVVSSPTEVYIIIKIRDVPVMNPISVIIT
jgi:hypothetical protein